MQLLPALDDDGLIITQSLAILEYLDERYPELPLLPKASAERAWARSMAQTVACDIHPLNNLRVLQYLKNELHAEEDARNQWYRHWVQVGLEGLEAHARAAIMTHAIGVTLQLAAAVKAAAAGDPAPALAAAAALRLDEVEVQP